MEGITTAQQSGAANGSQPTRSKINRRSDVIEGVISVKHEQPASGHTKGDVITIEGKEFEVNQFLVTPGYKTTISHGGALKQGVYARLHYHDGIILKAEIKTGQPGGAAHSHPR